MTDNITVLNIQRQTLNGPNNTTFTVTFINTDKGAFTAYDNTPGIQLATENSKLTVHYRINVKNGKTYKLDNDKQRAYGVKWMKYGRPVWMIGQKIRAIGGKILRKICPSFHKGRSHNRE